MALIFIGDGPRLEAEFEDRGSRWCCVITHPHSLMGGSMHNNVVMAAWKACASLAMSAVRFNFRGVGASGGSFDNGNGEMVDLGRVISYVSRPAVIIGYSFGAWVASRHLERTRENHPAILVSPPDTMFGFPDMTSMNVRAVVGSLDPFCDPRKIEGLVGHGRLKVFPGADHFWFGHEEDLASIIRGFVAELVRISEG